MAIIPASWLTGLTQQGLTTGQALSPTQLSGIRQGQISAQNSLAVQQQQLQQYLDQVNSQNSYQNSMIAQAQQQAQQQGQYYTAELAAEEAQAEQAQDAAAQQLAEAEKTIQQNSDQYTIENKNAQAQIAQAQDAASQAQQGQELTGALGIPSAALGAVGLYQKLFPGTQPVPTVYNTPDPAAGIDPSQITSGPESAVYNAPDATSIVPGVPAPGGGPVMSPAQLDPSAALAPATPPAQSSLTGALPTPEGAPAAQTPYQSPFNFDPNAPPPMPAAPYDIPTPDVPPPITPPALSPAEQTPYQSPFNFDPDAPPPMSSVPYDDGPRMPMTDAPAEAPAAEAPAAAAPEALAPEAVAPPADISAGVSGAAATEAGLGATEAAASTAPAWAVAAAPYGAYAIMALAAYETATGIYNNEANRGLSGNEARVDEGEDMAYFNRQLAPDGPNPLQVSQNGAPVTYGQNLGIGPDGTQTLSGNAQTFGDMLNFADTSGWHPGEFQQNLVGAGLQDVGYQNGQPLTSDQLLKLSGYLGDMGSLYSADASYYGVNPNDPSGFNESAAGENVGTYGSWLANSNAPWNTTYSDTQGLTSAMSSWLQGMNAATASAANGGPGSADTGQVPSFYNSDPTYAQVSAYGQQALGDPNWMFPTNWPSGLSYDQYVSMINNSGDTRLNGGSAYNPSSTFGSPAPSSSNSNPGGAGATNNTGGNMTPGGSAPGNTSAPSQAGWSSAGYAPALDPNSGLSFGGVG